MKIISYLISGISYLSKATLISTGMYLFFTIAILFKFGRNYLTKNYFFIKEYIFCTYIVTLGMITGVIGEYFNLNLHYLAFNIIPFRNVDAIQMILNILIFIPMGILLPILCRRINSCIWMMTISGFATILIEFIQLVFKGRLADINDIIANLLGAFIGFIIYRIFNTCISKYKKREYGIGTISMFWSSIACFLNIRYGGICIGAVFFYNLGVKTMDWIALNYCSELIIIGICIIGYHIGKRYPEDFGARTGQLLALLSIIVSLGVIIMI